jgi:hypothetical protein
MAIWPFRPKTPKLNDRAFEDLAQMFLSDPEDATPGGELLDSARFDFTLDSLAAMDAHLEVMRHRELQGQALVKFILRGGAYVGEVIRRQSPASKTWHWVEYDEALRLEPRLSTFGKALGTVAVLWDGKEGFCFPLAKVGKYLENGSEDSVKVFAEVILAKARVGL